MRRAFTCFLVMVMVGAAAGAGSGVAVDDLQEIARGQGFDFWKTEARAGKGDVRALRKIMRMTLHVDGGPAEELEDVLAGLLKRVGDGKFALALGQEPERVRGNVWNYFLMGVDEKWCPRTAKEGMRKGAARGTEENRGGKELLAAAGEREFGAGGFPDDTIAVAKECGIDCAKAAGWAEKGDVGALRTIMRFTAWGKLDAASAEGQATVLGELLRRVGDGKFAMALGEESQGVRKAVKEALVYDICPEQEDGTQDETRLTKDFPRTAGVIADSKTRAPGKMMFAGPTDGREGGLVVMWLTGGEAYGKKKKAEVLKTDYAIFMEWGRKERRFVVYDNPQRLVCSTGDFGEFLKAVAGLPRGVKVQEIDTCTVSASAGMPGSYRERLGKVMKEGGRTLVEAGDGAGMKGAVICTCGAGRYILPGRKGK